MKAASKQICSKHRTSAHCKDHKAGHQLVTCWSALRSVHSAFGSGGNHTSQLVWPTGSAGARLETVQDSKYVGQEERREAISPPYPPLQVASLTPSVSLSSCQAAPHPHHGSSFLPGVSGIWDPETLPAAIISPALGVLELLPAASCLTTSSVPPQLLHHLCGQCAVLNSLCL